MIVHEPCRKLWIVVPKSGLQKLGDQPLKLIRYADHNLRQQLRDSLARHAARTCKELASCDPKNLTAALAVDEQAATALIEAARKAN